MYLITTQYRNTTDVDQKFLINSENADTNTLQFKYKKVLLIQPLTHTQKQLLLQN